MKYVIYIKNKKNNENDSLISFSKSEMVKEVHAIIAENEWYIKKVVKITKGEYIPIFTMNNNSKD